MPTVRIALANIAYPATPNESIAHAIDAISDAAAAGADIICFPECYVPGYRHADWPVPISRPDGSLLAFQPYGEAGLLVADLDLSEATGLLAKRCRQY